LLNIKKTIIIKKNIEESEGVREKTFIQENVEMEEEEEEEKEEEEEIIIRFKEIKSSHNTIKVAKYDKNKNKHQVMVNKFIVNNGKHYLILENIKEYYKLPHSHFYDIESKDILEYLCRVDDKENVHMSDNILTQAMAVPIQPHGHVMTIYVVSHLGEFHNNYYKHGNELMMVNLNYEQNQLLTKGNYNLNTTSYTDYLNISTPSKLNNNVAEINLPVMIQKIDFDASYINQLDDRICYMLVNNNKKDFISDNFSIPRLFVHVKATDCMTEVVCGKIQTNVRITRSSNSFVAAALIKRENFIFFASVNDGSQGLIGSNRKGLANLLQTKNNNNDDDYSYIRKTIVIKRAVIFNKYFLNKIWQHWSLFQKSQNFISNQKSPQKQQRVPVKPHSSLLHDNLSNLLLTPDYQYFTTLINYYHDLKQNKYSSLKSLPIPEHQEQSSTTIQYEALNVHKYLKKPPRPDIKFFIIPLTKNLDLNYFINFFSKPNNYDDWEGLVEEYNYPRVINEFYKGNEKTVIMLITKTTRIFFKKIVDLIYYFSTLKRFDQRNVNNENNLFRGKEIKNYCLDAHDNWLGAILLAKHHPLLNVPKNSVFYPNRQSFKNWSLDDINFCTKLFQNKLTRHNVHIWLQHKDLKYNTHPLIFDTIPFSLSCCVHLIKRVCNPECNYLPVGFFKIFLNFYLIHHSSSAIAGRGCKINYSNKHTRNHTLNDIILSHQIKSFLFPLPNNLQNSVCYDGINFSCSMTLAYHLAFTKQISVSNVNNLTNQLSIVSEEWLRELIWHFNSTCLKIMLDREYVNFFYNLAEYLEMVMVSLLTVNNSKIHKIDSLISGRYRLLKPRVVTPFPTLKDGKLFFLHPYDGGFCSFNFYSRKKNLSPVLLFPVIEHILFHSHALNDYIHQLSKTNNINTFFVANKGPFVYTDQTMSNYFFLPAFSVKDVLEVVLVLTQTVSLPRSVLVSKTQSALFQSSCHRTLKIAENVLEYMHIVLSARHFLSTDVKINRDEFLLYLCENLQSRSNLLIPTKLSSMAMYIIASFYENDEGAKYNSLNNNNNNNNPCYDKINLLQFFFSSSSFEPQVTKKNSYFSLSVFNYISLAKILTLLILLRKLRAYSAYVYNEIYQRFLKNNVPNFLNGWIKSIFLSCASHDKQLILHTTALKNLENFFLCIFVIIFSSVSTKQHRLKLRQVINADIQKFKTSHHDIYSIFSELLFFSTPVKTNTINYTKKIENFIKEYCIITLSENNGSAIISEVLLQLIKKIKASFKLY